MKGQEVERQFSGQQVQRAHMILAQQKQDWPAISLPHSRGKVTPVDVLAVPVGRDRDKAIDQWCASVWEAFGDNRETVIELLRTHRII